MIKICNKCEQEKSISDFEFRKDTQKYRTACRLCLNTKNPNLTNYKLNKRICIKCNIEKDLIEFGTREYPNGTVASMPKCKECWSLSNLRPYSSKQNHLDGCTKVRHVG